jgi:YVTN family beta-propeller protein
VKVIARSACLVIALVLLPFGARSATIGYAPPAGNVPAGPYRGPFSAVLPSGRLVTPAGTSVSVGAGALGVALTPDGRYAIAAGGDALSVVDTIRMAVVGTYRAAGESFSGGLAVAADPHDPAHMLVFAAGGSANAVYAFDLDADGDLQPDPRHRIAVPGFPATLLASSDGHRLYVANLTGDSVATIDTASRTPIGAPVSAGFTPSGVAIAGTRLLVTNEGLMHYAASANAAAPLFGTPVANAAAASSLSLLALDPDGKPVAGADAVPMDPAPDGLRIVGGAHPSAIVATADGAYAFVAMTNVDRIATVALGAAPHVAGGTELRLFDRGPYGTQPAALALSHDGSRLYVALRGLDAIAVIDARDPLHLHRLGLIPTGWAPTAVALGADDRTLYVANQLGDGVASSVQRIDLAQVRLADATRAALAATRLVVPLPRPLPKAIQDVVLIVEDGTTFDDALGDLGGDSGAAAFTRYGASVTPNLHALARRFALAGNLFASGTGNVARQIVAGGVATAFAERTAGAAATLGPLGFTAEDPTDAPRLGTIFNELARHDLSFRDYGEFLSGPAPAPGILAGNVDLAYPARETAAPDTARAAEFVRDYGALVSAHRTPRFAYVALPGGGGTSAAAMAEGDRALGTIIDFLSHSPAWHTTAVFVVAADAGSGHDHVAPSRTFALVASPWVKPGYVGMRHLSTAGVLKTIDRIFSLPALSLGDLLSSDMGDFFTSQANRQPYVVQERTP